MSATTQILLGSAVLGLCSVFHVAFLIGLVGWLPRLHQHTSRLSPHVRRGIVVWCVFAIIVFAHTVQVWIWAAAFMLLGALPNWSDAIYFSLVTYTTLGYGDITLGQGTRLFAAMAAVAGLLTFGLSTAFLAGLLARLLNRYNEE